MFLTNQKHVSKLKYNRRNQLQRIVSIDDAIKRKRLASPSKLEVEKPVNGVQSTKNYRNFLE